MGEHCLRDLKPRGMLGSWIKSFRHLLLNPVASLAEQKHRRKLESIDPSRVRSQAQTWKLAATSRGMQGPVALDIFYTTRHQGNGND